MAEATKNKKRSKKISSKIAFSIIFTNLIVVCVIAGIMGYLLYQNVGQESRKFAVGQVESSVNKFQQDFSNIETAVSVLVQEVSVMTDVSKAKSDPLYLNTLKRELIPRLKSIGDNTDLTDSIYVYYNVGLFDQEVDMWMLRGDNDKFTLQDSFGMEYYDDYSPWYSEPIENGNTLWTFPYESAAGGIITSYVTPVTKNGEIIALVGMDLYLDSVAQTLAEVKLFETGYLYLMHPDGRTMVHPRVEFGANILDQGDFQFLLDEMNNNHTGFTSYDRDDGAGVVAAYSHLDNGWIVASSVPESEVLKILNMILKILAGIAVFAVIIAFIAARIVGNGISKPVLEVLQATEKIKDGDFTVQVSVKSKDETMLLANGLNEMTLSVKGLIGEARGVSQEMLDAASNLASMAEETNATVDQVASTVQEISKGTQDTARDAETGASVAGEINHKFDTLMENSSAMKSNAEVAIEMNKTGLAALEVLKEKSDISKASNEKVISAVGSLDTRASAITNIIATISSIAEQTNLLALNASIEAARAGEAGRGFAVVADEIRKLAEDSSSATNEIREIVTSIQQESKDTVKIMNEVSEISNEQNEAVGNVTDSFNQIFTSVEGITDQIEVVATELDGLSNNKDEIVGIVSNISAVSEETAAGTEQVSHSMDEQSKAVEEVARNAERLNELSIELNNQIDIFKI